LISFFLCIPCLPNLVRLYLSLQTPCPKHVGFSIHVTPSSPQGTWYSCMSALCWYSSSHCDLDMLKSREMQFPLSWCSLTKAPFCVKSAIWMEVSHKLHFYKVKFQCEAYFYQS
jgi:hypothetical protein